MTWMITKKILGVILLLFGLFALIVPLMPGAWLAFIGIELLGLTFLLPRPVRERWHCFKIKLMQRLGIKMLG